MSPFLKIMIGFTIANFIWQACFGREWMVAAERSWFQCAAIAFLWFAGFTR